MVKRPLLIIGLVVGAVWWSGAHSSPWMYNEGRAWITTASAQEPMVMGATTENPPLGWDKVVPETYAALITETDAAAVLARNGVATDAHDYIRTYPDLNLGVGGTVYVYRAPVVTVIDWGVSQVAHTWAATVKDVLVDADVVLGDQDQVDPELGTQAGPGDPLTITITRVNETDVQTTESISYSTRKQDDPTLDRGKQRVITAGKKGVRTKTYHVRRENGVEVSRVLTDDEVTTDPVTEVIAIGTKPVITGWCKYDDIILAAAAKNGIDPNVLCNLMRVESNGHANSVGQGGAHLGLFQYDPGFWASASSKAGYAGASIYDPTAQIYVTAWALTHGYAGRW